MKYPKELYRFLKHILENRKLFVSLVKHDFKKSYLGSYLGLLWAFIQPLSMILVLWFVFDVGLKGNLISTEKAPFILWFMAGMIPWFFFSNSVQNGTSSIVSNAFLVQKVVFRVSLLPLIKITSALIIHLFFIILLTVIFMFHGYYPNLYWLQIPYYLLCSIFLVLGISWLTSSLMVFIKDIGQAIGVILQLGFWITPIFWNITMVPEAYRWVLKINPMYYIVNGYRDSFINHIWFWENGEAFTIFMITTTTLFVAGALVFKRLRPHFADVL